MSMLRLYTRVLELLGKEARLGWILAFANLLLAAAQFAEPVLFGKIVDVLSGKPQTGPLASNSAWPLLAAWVAFGLFTIACSALVALGGVSSPHRASISRSAGTTSPRARTSRPRTARCRGPPRSMGSPSLLLPLSVRRAVISPRTPIRSVASDPATPMSSPCTA